MTGKTHDMIGFAALATIALIYSPTTLNGYTAFACIVGNVVGSMIPDIDDAGNRLWDLLPAGNYIGKIARKLFYRHRTISHSLLGGWLLYKALEVILPKIFNPSYIDYQLVFVSIFIGFVAHLLADMMTKDGIPLLFPFKWYFGIPPLSFLRMRTGGLFETYVVFPGTFIYIAFLGYLFQKELLQLLGFV